MGNALKEIGAPRESVVVLTKVYNAVGDDPAGRPDALKLEKGYVNESGLSRKVRRALERETSGGREGLLIGSTSSTAYRLA